MTTNKDNGIWQKIKEESFEPCPCPMGGGIKMDDCRVIDLDDLKPIIDDLLKSATENAALKESLRKAKMSFGFDDFGEPVIDWHAEYEKLKDRVKELEKENAMLLRLSQSQSKEWLKLTEQRNKECREKMELQDRIKALESAIKHIIDTLTPEISNDNLIIGDTVHFCEQTLKG